MTTRVDPRLARRRRTVAEGNARRRLRRIFWSLVAIAAVAAIGWVLQSPWFSISHIAVSGVAGSNTHQILEEAGVVEGTPLIAVGPRRVENLLEADPWVIDATVRRGIPDAIEVVVYERTPLAWVQVGTEWAVLADDGTVLRYDSEAAGPRMVFELTSDRLADERVKGGIVFLAGLPTAIRNQVSLAEHDGELWGDVAGLIVRLGLPTDMAEKAAALQAVLEEGVAPGSVVNLVAPARPAVVEA